MKKSTVKRNVFVVAVAVAVAALFAGNEVTFAKKKANKNNKVAVEYSLSDYNVKTTIEDEEQIREIADKYNLEDAEYIEKIIYVPIDEEVFVDEDEYGVSTADIGNEEYYVEKISSSEKKGELLRSSWYEYPGGSMTISESVATSYDFSAIASVEGGKDTLKAELKTAYGFSVTKSVTISDTQKVKVKKGCKRNIKAYVNNCVYKYELWEDDLIFDDKIGKGTITKPIGVIFSVGKNVKK